jgi:hypothetical protein
MSTWHAIQLVRVEVIAVHANFTNPPFCCDASILAGVPRMLTPGQHATFLLDFFRIVKQGLEKALLCPHVFL